MSSWQTRMSKSEKLARYIDDHGVTVIDWSDDEITVVSQYTRDGELFSEEETIVAETWAVKQFLGY